MIRIKSGGFRELTGGEKDIADQSNVLGAKQNVALRVTLHQMELRPIVQIAF